jgi:hypothetical protein
MTLPNPLLDHGSALPLSVASALGTLGLAAGALPVPAGLPAWLPYLSTIVGPVLIFIVQKVLAARAARDRSLADSKAKRAAQLRADNDPSNDGEAAKLEDEVDSLAAEAAALDAVAQRK